MDDQSKSMPTGAEQPKRTLKERVQGFMPNMGEIMGKLDARFETLIQKLDEMLQELKKMNEKLGPK